MWAVGSNGIPSAMDFARFDWIFFKFRRAATVGGR